MAKLNVEIPANEVVIDGVTYRKVERKAAAGDVVKAIESGLDITKGAFYAVINRGGDARILDDDNDPRDPNYSGVENRYEVYEKVTEPSESTAPKVELPDEFTLTYERIGEGNEAGPQVGDVIIFEEAPREYITAGKRYEVVGLDCDDAEIIDDDGDTWDTCGTEFALYRKKEEVAEHLDGSRGGWACESDLVRATDEEVAEAKRKLDPRSQFAKGDKVRLVSGGGEVPLAGYKNGEIYEVSDPTTISNGGKRVQIKGGKYSTAYALPSDIVKVTAEELAEAAEAAKWAAIGRKVGEYKAGDVVKFVKVTGSHGLKDHVGITTEIVRDDKSDRLRYRLAKPTYVPSGDDTWTSAESLELIVPVESRFDKIAERSVA